MPQRLKTLGTRVEDFCPWVPAISCRPSAREEEEEGDKMADLVHKFGTRKRKQGDNFKQSIGATLEVA